MNGVTNLLLNPLWEEGFYAFRNDSNLEVARGWLPWWRSPEPTDRARRQQRPRYDSFFIDGSEVQRIRSPRATHDGGLLQQVLVAPGGSYRLTAECKVWSSVAPIPGNLVDPASVHVQLGIDLGGGVDPDGEAVLWSEVAESTGVWSTLSLEVSATDPLLTVFLRTAPQETREQQVSFWRRPHLEPLQNEVEVPTVYVGPGETQITLDPLQPIAGQTVDVVVTSNVSQLFCDLAVRTGTGEHISASYKGKEQLHERHSWHYQIELPAPGLYDVRFVGDEGARMLARDIMQVGESDEQAFLAVPIPRLERPDYRSIYVLLPPTADKRWYVAAAGGAFEGRYSIGFSADDAAGGPASERHVLVVNPHHWPDELDDGWFNAYYPGTVYTAVVVETPADLEYWLRNWSFPD